MHAVVVYESMFGNTELIARAIAEGLALQAEVDLLNVDDAPGELAGIDLLVVGGPTHAHGMSRPGTRQGAAQQSDEGVRSKRTGIREWLGTLGPAPAGTQAVAFDTRLDKPRWLTGSAAKGAGKLLRRQGYRMPVPPQSFFVAGTAAAHLAPGEQDRARDWAGALATRASTTA
jgi:hypothetical protein